jgi:hypothetical protein
LFPQQLHRLLVKDQALQVLDVVLRVACSHTDFGRWLCKAIRLKLAACDKGQISGNAQRGHHSQISPHGGGGLACLYSVERHARDPHALSQRNGCKTLRQARAPKPLTQLDKKLPVKG